VVSSALLVWSVTEARQNSLEVVTLNFASWNHINGWLRELDSLRRVA
jgi:hypothetical protein